MVLALMGRLRIIQPCEKPQTPQKQHYWQMEPAAELKRRGKAPRRHKYLRASRARINHCCERTVECCYFFCYVGLFWDTEVNERSSRWQSHVRHFRAL